jgi:hypothetical protein
MMPRLSLLSGLFLALAPLPAPAAEDARKDDKGTFLGVLIGPRSEKPSSSAPTAGKTVPPSPDSKPASRPPARGVVVTHVLPDSPAARADLRRGDILLEYDHKAIRDGDHLVQLIRDDKPARKVQLVFQRGAKVQTVEATLTLGPALKLASDRGDSPAAASGRGTVSVWAAPLESGKMKVTIQYYATGKLQTLSCEGAAELARTVQKLPERERNLVRLALQRLRSLNSTSSRSDSGPVKR